MATERYDVNPNNTADALRTAAAFKGKDLPGRGANAAPNQQPQNTPFVGAGRRGHDRTECGADDHADGEIENVAPHDEVFEFVNDFHFFAFRAFLP